ncbi:MucR family transcriptional regulator [Methylobacterium sp. J-030]|uniref:MucR family transcriptional regulator n=1 Tax=Methylobacterium sp. J-030 TaxID=2836627 RepID=UPI001FB8916D|nr:MucR family transcriptional regulator [Methylobacterium sp. J-030]MCJ2071402.1 MucR family transcriptional regulator [Methylobacterium sp. J-030]
MTIEASAVDFIDLTANVVSAYVSKNSVRPGDMAELIANTHAALKGLGQGSAAEAPAIQKLTPGQIRKSITPDALISFIDGKPYKTLKRHVTGNGMTMEEYRTRFGLPSDYPSVAASYSEPSSALAKNLGLGQQRKNSAKAGERAEVVSDKQKRAAGGPRKSEGSPVA